MLNLVIKFVITIVATILLVFAGLLLFFIFWAKNPNPNYPTFAAEVAAFLTPLDLSDRETSLSIHDQISYRKVFPGCRKNFSAGPCRKDFWRSMSNEIPRTDDPRVASLNFLSNAFVNTMIYNLVPLDREPIFKPEYYCTTEDLAQFSEWANRQHRETLTSDGIVVVLPETFFHCQYHHDRTKNPDRFIFWIWAQGNAVGRIECNKPEFGHSPQCSTNMYINMGETMFSPGGISAVNIKDLVFVLTITFQDFLAYFPEKTADIIKSGVFKEPLTVSEEAKILMQQIESDLQ